MADRADIDRVREATDIVELVSEVTKVKRSGRSFMAVCPFHEEKTPSMSLDRAKGFYHCFGCGKGGDVFGFVEETQGLGFRESLEVLARKAGITLTENPLEAARSGRRSAAVEALRQAIEVYNQRLKRAPEAGPARAYLRSRGYDADLIEQWKLGFAGVGWDTLSKELRASGVPDKVQIEAGIARRGRHGLYDFFRGRLMFPIHDLRGDPVGFGGRKVEGVDREATNNPDAKYVNSADSAVYSKARLLYGLDRARRNMSETDPAVVVEGYTDVIAMHQAGITTAVATCGTALGDGHFDLIRRFTDRVVLAFDSDEAGSKAALRGDELESPFRLDLDLRVAVMPDGLDPADLVQTGRSDELIQAVTKARPLLERRIEHEVGRFDLKGPEGRARALHAAGAQLQRVRDPVARREYARFVARLVGVEVEDVMVAIGRAPQSAASTKGAGLESFDVFDVELLRALLTGQIPPDSVMASDLEQEVTRHAFALVQPRLEASGSDGPKITGLGDEEAESTLRQIILTGHPAGTPEEILERLRVRRLDRKIDALEREMNELESGTDAHSDMLRKLIALQKEKRAKPKS